MEASPPEPRERISAWVIAVAMVLLMAVAIAVFVDVQSTRARATMESDGARQERAVQLHAASLIQALVDSQNSMRAYVLTRHEIYLDPYFSGERDAAAEVRALDRLIAILPAHKGAYAAARADYAHVDSIVDQTVAQARAGHYQGALALAQADEAQRAMRAVRSSLGALQQEASRRGAFFEHSVNHTRTQIDRLITYLGALFVATIVFTLFWVFSERGALQDVATRLREANTALDAARQRAEDADTAKSRFLALASHDMRQPLHAITLYLAALKRRVENPQAKDIVAHMEMAATSLTRMFSGLLDLARIESGVLKAKPVTFALQEAFDAVASEAMAEAAPSKITLRVVRTSAEVHSDPELLESILRNLLTNAYKYAPNGRVLIGARRRGGRVRIEVRDEGPGIAKDKLVMVFGEFVRLDAAKGAVVDGLGLGLSIAARLARLLGSSLEVESEVGKGACFFLTLPLARAAVGAPEAGDAHAPPGLSGLRIAVKDDEPLALAAMAAVLADAGADVHAFANSTQFMNAVADGADYDLVIGDPVLLRESAGALVQRQGRARPPVIVLTGATDGPTLAALDAAKTEFLIKPVAEDTLLAAAARVARTRKRQTAG